MPLPTFRTIFDEHFVFVLNSLRRLGVREGDLADVAQEVFITLCRILADYDAARPIRPWLFGIAYRYAARYRSLVRHVREVPDENSDAPSPEPTAEDALVAAEARALVCLGIRAIGRTRRSVFIMAELDGCSAPEIAEELDVPVNTVYSRLREARREFVCAVSREGRLDPEF